MAWTAFYTNGYASSYGFVDQNDITNMPNAQVQNALEIYYQLLGYGWSVNAIAATVSNILTESYINPGQREHQYSMDTLIGGYGLCQWSDVPSQGVYNNTTLHNWLTSNGYQLTDGAAQIKFLDGMNEYLPGQWSIRSIANNITWEEFRVSTLDPATLANYFMWCYEKPANQDQPIRGVNANYFYTLFTNIPAPVKPKKMPIYFYLKHNRRL